MGSRIGDRGEVERRSGWVNRGEVGRKKERVGGRKKKGGII